MTPARPARVAGAWRICKSAKLGRRTCTAPHQLSCCRWVAKSMSSDRKHPMRGTTLVRPLTKPSARNAVDSRVTKVGLRSQGVENNCSRCEAMETQWQRCAKLLSRTCGNNRNLHHFARQADKNSPRFVGKILVTWRKIARVSIVSCRYTTEVVHTAGCPCFAAPALVLHTLRTCIRHMFLNWGVPLWRDRFLLGCPEKSLLSILEGAKSLGNL